MFCSLLIIAVAIEGFGPLNKALLLLQEKKGTAFGAFILLFPGTLAFCMTSAEFALLQRTSVVTLSICGIFKEVVTITAAEIVFHDPLTPINISGLLVTIGSIAAYNYIKITKMRQEARDMVKAEHDAAEEEEPMLEGQDEQYDRQDLHDIEATRGHTVPPGSEEARILSRRRVSDGSEQQVSKQIGG
jgi:solute carrier family 35 protein C2